jgi:hypothetical protein
MGENGSSQGPNFVEKENWDGVNKVTKPPIAEVTVRLSYMREI